MTSTGSSSTNGSTMQVDEYGFYAPVWPTACPPYHLQADVLSVTVGNSHMVWGLHSSYQNDYVPSFYWNTVASLTYDGAGGIGDDEDDDDDNNNNNSSQKPPTTKIKRPLRDFFAVDVREQLFGSTDFTTSSAAQHRYTRKRIPYIYLYVISTNPQHASTLMSVFSGIPCIMYRLSAKDFLELPITDAYDKAAKDSDQKPAAPIVTYDGIGIDRVANVVGAKVMFPGARNLLVIDGGTALTYTTTVRVPYNDHTNNIDSDNTNTKSSYRYRMGGGIGLGLQMRFRPLFDYTYDIPFVNSVEVAKMLEECTKQEKPLPLFTSCNSPLSSSLNGDDEHDIVQRRSIVGCIMTETTLLLCSIISKWLASPRDSDPPNGNKSNSSIVATQQNNDITTIPMVVLTGGDSKAYKALLQPRHSYICETNQYNIDLLGRAIMVDEIVDEEAGTKQNKKETDTWTINDKSFRIQRVTCLQFQAVAHVLSAHAAANNSCHNSDLEIDLQLIRNQLSGLRIARQSTSTSSKKVTLGTIVAIQQGKQLDDDQCIVIYDGKKEIHSLTIREVYDALLLFTQHPEKSKLEKIRIGQECRLRDAKDGVSALDKASPTIRKLIESQKSVPMDSGPESTVGNVDEIIASLKRKNLDSTTKASTSSKRRATVDPKSYINKKIAKEFEVQDESGKKIMALFFGTIKGYVEKHKWWHIEYEDGDNEDMSINELTTHLQLYEKNKSKDTN